MLNQKSALEAFEQVLAKYGEETTYRDIDPRGAKNTCFYSVDGAPACIVGQILAITDPEGFAKIVEIEEESGSSANAEDVLTGDWEYTDWHEIGYAFTSDPWLVKALAHAQNLQDGGATWGTAFEEFKKALW